MSLPIIIAIDCSLSGMLSKAQGDAEITVAQKCLEVALVYDRYEALLRDQDAFDFGDLIMRPALLLERDVELREQISARYQHVLVDEYQDVNRASAHLLKAISGDGKRVWVVGDARQSIYRFRGASPTNLLSFETEFSGKAGRLAINYRSTKQIVDTFCKIAKKLTASEHQLPLELKANRGAGVAAPEMRVFDNPDAEAIGIAESVLELQAQGVRLREQAVLCRSNARLVNIAAALESRGIPVLHLGSLFERDDVRDLLALLSVAVDKFGAGLVRVGAFPRYALSLQDVYSATKWLRESDKKPVEALSACAAEAEGLSEHGRAALSLLAEDLTGLTQSVLPWDFLCVYLLDRTNAVRELVKDESISGQMTTVAFWQFMNFVRAPTFGGTGSPVRRLLDRVRELVLLTEERGLREVPDNALHLDAVRLMTIHASKGLEFEAVHVPTLTTGSFPVSIRPDRCPPPTGMVETFSELPPSAQAKVDHDAEEDCLFFVAISRAKSHLRLYRAAAHAGGNKSGESRYVGWMAEIGIVPERRNVQARAPGKELKPIVVERAAPFVPDVGDLSQYQRCPRRFFYTHVLELGTAQHHTPFTQTHDVIHALLERYKAGDSAPKSPEDLENILADLWDDLGPVKHEAAAEYQQLAQTIAASLQQTLQGETILASEPQTLSFSSGNLLVEPDQMGRHADGRPFVRRMNTGKKRSDEYDRLEYAVYQLVSEKLGASFEASFLTDDLHEFVPPLTARKMTGRREKIEGHLDGLKRGEFPPDPNVVSCPNCPHFFICDSVPQGALKID